jgi:hypothetical protein
VPLKLSQLKFGVSLRTGVTCPIMNLLKNVIKALILETIAVT